MLLHRALYRHGQRVDDDLTIPELAAACRDHDALAWVGLYEPDADELAEVAAAFDLPELAVEDTIQAHQRPKLERYGDLRFLVLRPARYVDATETVVFGDVYVFAGPHFVVTVRQGEAPELGAVRRAFDERPELVRRGPDAVLHAIADRVVDDYLPVAAGIENDIDEIEDELFAQAGDPSKRTYELIREVIAFHRAVRPLAGILQRLIAEPGLPAKEAGYLRDVLDHVERLSEEVDGFRQLLDNILRVVVALETKALGELSNRQSEEVKRISAWAAILFAPTVVGTIYGMNFTHMPELDWRLGYPVALASMLAICLLAYAAFRRRGWI